MTRINPLENFDEPVTRQTLFDMWDGSLTAVGLSDLSEDFLPILTGSTFSDAPAAPVPGQLFWHQTDALMFCWHDKVDDTGVSLWLAIGPDRFETAVLTIEPIPAGFPLQLSRDRKVCIAEPSLQAAGCLGFNQSGIDNGKTCNLPFSPSSGVTSWGGHTAASGAWIRAGVDGFVFAKVENALSCSSNRGNSGGEDFMCLDDRAGRAGSVAKAGISSTFQSALFNGVGASVEGTPTVATQTPTEPAVLFKLLFAPRYTLGF